VRCDLGRPILQAEAVPTLLPAGKDGIAREVPLTLRGRELAVTAVSTGVPHAVIFLEEIASFPWLEIGPLLEAHPAFPRKTNVNFVQILDGGRAIDKVWERGAGPTQACGTGACAVVVAGVLTGRLGRRAVVAMPGGELKVTWRDADGHLELEGPVAEVGSGSFIYPCHPPKEDS
jgi:diaminopimelate epimerase